MRTIIAGSRSITTVISGTARGVDKLGERWAKEQNIFCERYPADWETHGRRAGYLRNVEMAKRADACIVLWDGVSRGSAMMIQIAEQCRLKLLVYKQTQTGWNSVITEF